MWQLRLSCAYWRHHLWWLGGGALSVAVTVGLALVITQLWLETRHTYTLVQQPLGTADAHIIASDDEGMFAAWQTNLETLPHIDIITPVLSRQTLAIKNGENISVQVRGVEPETNTQLHPTRLLGGRMVRGDEKTSVVVSSTLAKELGVGVNATLDLLTPRGTRTYTVVGISDEVSSTVIAPLNEIQELFTSGEQVDGFDVRFTANADQNLAVLKDRLKNVATVLTASERVRSVRDVVIAIRLVLLVVFIFSLTMMFCLLLGLLETSRSERQLERKALAMLGISQQALARWRRLELSALLITASVVGVSVATVLVQPQMNAAPLLVAALVAVMIIAITLFLESTLSKNIDKQQSTGLGANARGTIRLPLWTRSFQQQRFAWPPSLWLAWQLLNHMGKRYWLAVLSLTLALTGFTSLGLSLQAQRQSLEALVSKRPILTERTLEFQEEYPASLSTTTRWNMAMMPGVVFVSSYLTKVTMEEKFEEDLYVLDVASFPYQSYLHTTDGISSEDLPKALQTERTLAISNSLADSYKLKAGMSLRLRTPSGSHRYKIVATLKDIGGVSRAMFVGRDSYLQDWGRENDGLFVLSFEETLQAQHVEQLLQNQLERSPGLPWTIVSFKSDLERLLGKMLAWCRWLMLLFIGVTVSALLHALSSPTLQGLLSTLYLLGGQQHLLKQLARRTVLITTFIFTTIALAVGTTLSYVLVDGLTQSNTSWVWQLSIPSYTPSLAIFLLLFFFLALMTNKVLRLK